ncbi:MAG: hypothetical protein ACOC2L_05005, partial [Candidatus Sumerlaeota bacterium]
LQADKQQEVLDHLELLAKTHPEVCAGIAGEILTKWSTAVRPQVQQNNQVNLGIPLTRAQQKRNIRNLADLSKRLRSLPGDPIDPQDLVNAFASCHSPAEVFKIEDIELVLGPVGSLGDETVIALVTAMQSRLADSWRDPETQSNNMTNRTVKESEEEVKRGYRLAVDIMKRCLPRYEDDPSFLTKLGGVLYDAAEYDYSLNSKLSEYTEKRDAAFAYYRRAAQKYGESVSELQPFEYKADAYLRWYFATLGASDPSYLTAQQEYSHQRLEDIRLSIRELGESAADTHFSILGKQLAATYSRVPSQVKYRYLETSLMLLGNHPSGQEIDQIKTRYDELLDEIRLHAEVDGDTDVGHTQDFGLKISIVHTPEIAREGGGFAKYLTSANTRNYQLQRAFGQMSLRDNFEENIEKALNDTFNVKFITFCEPSVQARETGEDDWYETPMAYVQLQANDARIDQIPPIQMDLHFVDQGGAVVLPIESQLVMINARPEAVPPGDIPQLEITEILDERELDEGKMTLEIQATARGIIPDFDSLFKTEWGKTKMVNVIDQGMQVTRIESDDDKFQPVVERAWIVDLEQPVEMSTTANFNFPQPTIEVKELAYKRYDDADLADAESVIKLHMPGSGISVMGVLFFVVPGVLVLALLIALIVYLRRAGGAEVEDEHDYHMPSRLTPFTLTHLLRRIQADQTLALATERREELMGEIEQIERGYFAPSSESDGVELEPLARKWVHEARTHRP